MFRIETITNIHRKLHEPFDSLVQQNNVNVVKLTGDLTQILDDDDKYQKYHEFIKFCKSRCNVMLHGCDNMSQDLISHQRRKEILLTLDYNNFYFTTFADVIDGIIERYKNGKIPYCHMPN
jgi:hypothetical protein